jgi:CNT family concentrative nucleoside transporter
MERLTPLLGVVVLVAMAWALSSDRRRFPWRIVIVGLALQLLIAGAFLSFPPLVVPVDALSRLVAGAIRQADEGIRFVFGPELIRPDGPWGFVFAVKVLPVIVFFAALMAVLYRIGIMPRIVGALAWLLHRTLGVSGEEALVAASNVFVGQTEAPLCIKPYLPTLTRAQVMVLMTTGFATIAGSVLAAYVGMLGGPSPESQALFAKHLLTASLMSAPAALVMARVMVPEVAPVSAQPPRLHREALGANVLDAAALGASDGLRLALNVAAMLIAFVSLIALVNWPLRSLGTSLEEVLGVLFWPFAWLMGAPEGQRVAVGGLLGQQVVATEFVAYVSLRDAMASGQIDARTGQIVTYALCGFCNLPSIAIQIGGLTALAPERRPDFVDLGPRAMVAGALACWSTACAAALFL